MKRNNNSERVTVFCNEEDVKLLVSLCIEHAGAAKPELFRMGLRALAGGPPPVRVVPQLAPPATLKSTLAGVRSISRLLDQAIRHGWPDHIDGESAERYKRVEEARRIFTSALAQLAPVQKELISLTAAVAVIPTVNIAEVKRGAKRVAKHSANNPDLSALAEFLKGIGILDS